MTPLTPVAPVIRVIGVTATSRRRWWQALTVALAVGYVVIGVLSPAPSIRWPFLLGGSLVLGGLAVVTLSRSAAWALLLVGAVAPVATTWWSIVGPVTALLILGCGAAAIRATRTPTSPNPPAPPHARLLSRRR